ncbi:MAG TPA: thiamine-phosphate kinase [Rhizomicrobium sp.]|jgi:thiamine-monophosphate kinase|nr:thiamine-phosphate kinase [Rhizomicrobium sp.]
MTNSSSEFELIAELFAPLATSSGAFGLKDDVALVAARAGHDLVVTTDMIVAGVDFFANDPPASIAKKALRVNLSDLAAKGAEPFGYLLSLMLPKEIGRPFLKDFAAGLESDQTEFAISLLGGDMSATPGPPAISITAFGHVPVGRIVRRNGAREGDLVFVTGTIGDSGGGLALLKNQAVSTSVETRTQLIGRYHVPEPRVMFAPALRAASAAIDVSDGLLADLGHIADASGVRIELQAGRIPLSPFLLDLWGDGVDAIARAATAGDDYEIAFTARSPIADARTAVTRIGKVTKGSGIVLLDAEGGEITVPRKGFVHF